MKIQLSIAGVAIVLATFLLAGCGGSGEEAGSAVPPVPETAEEAATTIEREFIEAPEEVKQNAKITAQAMQQSDWQKATVALYTLQQNARTREQRLAVRNSMIRLQQDLAEAIESGDPGAKAAAEFIQRRSSGGR